MKKQKQQTAINSNALVYLKSFLNQDVKIVDLYIWGKWLKAELSSGCSFSVKNKSTD